MSNATTNWWEESGREPILVTGAIRTGTTFIGKILAAGSGNVLVNEPFNRDNNALYELGWKRQFQYLTQETGMRYEPLLRGVFRLEPNMFGRTSNLISKKGLRNMYHSFSHMMGGPPQRVILKDPIALASASWIADTFHARVVITVRHPAPFCLSLKKLQWGIETDFFLQQEDLMEEHLAQFRPELEELRHIKGYDLRLAILGWRVLYHLAWKQMQQHPEFILVRHEDVSANPVEYFCELFHALNQPFTSDVIALIEECVSEENPVTTPSNDPHSIHVNASAGLQFWKSHLSPSEIAQIKEGTADICPKFYTEEDWY